eukprot:jgi/Ulvmu1/974/UM103_0001.1
MNIDNAIDLQMTRVVYNKARGQCVWFGTAGKCVPFVALAWVIIGAVAVKTLRGFVWSSLANGLISHGEDWKWLGMSGHVTTLLCELSIGTATLLNAVSLAAGADSASNSTWRRELCFALVSVVFTIAAFCFAAFGVHTVLCVLRATAVRISERFVGRVRVRPSERADTPPSCDSPDEAAVDTVGSVLDTGGVLGGRDVTQASGLHGCQVQTEGGIGAADHAAERAAREGTADGKEGIVYTWT